MMVKQTFRVFLMNGESLVKYHGQNWCTPSYTLRVHNEPISEGFILLGSVEFEHPDLTLEWLAQPVLKALDGQIKEVYAAAAKQVAELEKTKSVLLMLAGPESQGTRDNSQAEDAPYNSRDDVQNCGDDNLPF